MVFLLDGESDMIVVVLFSDLICTVYIESELIWIEIDDIRIGWRIGLWVYVDVIEVKSETSIDKCELIYFSGLGSIIFYELEHIIDADEIVIESRWVEILVCDSILDDSKSGICSWIE